MRKQTKTAVGIDLWSGDSLVPEMEGIWDNYRVKKQLFNLAPVLAQQMLLVDVLVGRFVQGKEGMKMCPLVPGSQFARYNSLVNRPADPSIFVVQHSNQAYPAYLITYRP